MKNTMHIQCGHQRLAPCGIQSQPHTESPFPLLQDSELLQPSGGLEDNFAENFTALQNAMGLCGLRERQLLVNQRLAQALLPQGHDVLRQGVPHLPLLVQGCGAEVPAGQHPPFVHELLEVKGHVFARAEADLHDLPKIGQGIDVLRNVIASNEAEDQVRPFVLSVLHHRLRERLLFVVDGQVGPPFCHRLRLRRGADRRDHLRPELVGQEDGDATDAAGAAMHQKRLLLRVLQEVAEP
mmetsp:Transcript_48609/g.80004  ORF Transcript_48609/g.80004 Transcript_48609/m.80004 type:complete len:239 (+) Transcript_48609:228-944(+)